MGFNLAFKRLKNYVIFKRAIQKKKEYDYETIKCSRNNAMTPDFHEELPCTQKGEQELMKFL
jgi:hypothetical protein